MAPLSATTRHTIEVFGSASPRARRTLQRVERVVRENRLHVRLENVETLPRMLELGIHATPAIAIDGDVVVTGRVPAVEEVRALLSSISREARQLLAYVSLIGALAGAA